jgi:energy-coupling factor transporter ATP-binding protein EcfA2
MSSSRFIASKVRSNRPGWSVTFRHPARTDSKNQRGLKIRKGLGTSDDAQADEYVRQLNELLDDEVWWSADKRKDAGHQYDPVVVSIFFDGIEVGSFNSATKRELIIPLPSREDGYGRIMLLGTTGAGKTTLLRHLIGSDHEADRFPSTSTAKTTTADTEIITADGDFEAAVTFTPEHQVRAYIDECLEAACLEAVQRNSPAKIMSAFLQHEEQRFRLSYILGSWRTASKADEDEFSFGDEISEEVQIEEDEVVGVEEQKVNHTRMERYLSSIQSIASSVEARVAKEIGDLKAEMSADDRAAWLEIFENEVFYDAAFAELGLDIMDDVSRRFDLISEGVIERVGTDWPTSWTYQESDRSKFLSHVRWFSSNHHKQFGRLLTPLVDGIRVKGPFYPDLEGVEAKPKLVLIDGEGIGHTANDASSISTRITQKFEMVDLILIVDNSQQPMQAAPLALLRTIGSSGFSRKLAIAFTHFDQVKGVNLSSFDQKKEHVTASIRNALSSIRGSVGPGIAGALERQIERNAVFLGGLNRPTEKIPAGFIRELLKLFTVMQDATAPAKAINGIPIYQFKGLEIAMRDAIDAFRNPWRGRLGLSYHGAIPKEHWTRVKALSRRLANGGDEYSNLRPVADLLSSLQEEAAKWLDRPADWSTMPADEDEREAALDPIRQAVFSRLNDLVTTRLRDDQLSKWRDAYEFFGKGSASRRADLINNIHHDAAPHMSAAMTQDARNFLDKLYIILQEAILESGGEIKALAA